MPEELDAVGSRFIFVSNTVRRGDEHSVGNCVRSLRSSPRIELRLTKPRLLVRMPADGGGIEQDLRTQQRIDPRGRFSSLLSRRLEL